MRKCKEGRKHKKEKRATANEKPTWGRVRLSQEHAKEKKEGRGS